MRCLVVGWLLVAGSASLPPAVQAQQESSGLEFASAVEQALVDVIAENEKSVVAILRMRRPPQIASRNVDARLDAFRGQRINPLGPDAEGREWLPNDFATGVVIDAAGLILTNHHVLAEDSDYLVTTHDRKPYPAQVVAADPRSDLAVLKIEASDLRPVTMGDAAQLRKGQIVVALGNPYAIARDGQASASWGIVSNLARKAGLIPGAGSAGKPTLHHHGTLIQTDAKLNLGTSGGLLVNLRGQMVGLTTSLAAVSGFEQPAGYAIPVDAAFLRVIETLKSGREVEYGFLGIQTQNLAMQELQSGAAGAQIVAVVDGTPASKAQLDVNDVILAVDGRPVHDADELILNVGRLPAGVPTRLTIDREGRRMEVDVELAKFAVQGRKIVTDRGPSWRGLRVDFPTAVAELVNSPYAWYDGNSDCVAIIEVAEGTSAWEQGLRPGMLVTHVAGSAVHNPREFFAQTAAAEGSVSLRLAARPGQPTEVSINAEL